MRTPGAKLIRTFAMSMSMSMSMSVSLLALGAAWSGCGPQGTREGMVADNTGGGDGGNSQADGGRGGSGMGGSGGAGSGGGGMNTGGGSGGMGGDGGGSGGAGDGGNGTGGDGGGSGGVDANEPDVAIDMASPDLPPPDMGTVVPTMGLVGYWKLDDGTGTTAKDDSGSGNNATLEAGAKAPMWTTGAHMGSAALAFDGTDDSSSLTSFTKLPALNAAKTIALWALWSALPGDTERHVFFAMLNQNAKAGVHLGFRTKMLSVWNWTPTDMVTATAPMPGWHHIAYTFDGTTHKLFVDGVMAGMGTAGTQTGTVVAACMGNAVPTATQTFKGSLDDIRVYDRALGVDEIKALMTAP
jgi:hypothetical protein